MTAGSVRAVVIVSVSALAVMTGVAPAAAFQFDRGRYQLESLDSVAAVSGASILRAFPREPSTYRCPTFRIWIGYLDADRAKVAYPLMPSSGGDYAPSPSDRVTYAVGRGSEGGRGSTIVVFCQCEAGSSVRHGNISRQRRHQPFPPVRLVGSTIIRLRAEHMSLDRVACRC